MEEIIYFNDLFDYYGCLLTDKQQEYFQKYYFENLTMQEIADQYKISKNAIAKQLDLIKEKLVIYESKLFLLKRKEKINKLIDHLDPKLIEEINNLI